MGRIDDSVTSWPESALLWKGPLATAIVLGTLLAVLLAMSAWTAVATVFVSIAGVLSMHLKVSTFGKLVLIAAVLAPTLLVGGIVPLRPEDFFIVAGIVSLRGRLLQWRSRWVAALSILLLLYASLFFAATLYGVLRLRAPLLLSDLFSVLAVVRLVLILLVGAQIGRIAWSDRRIGRGLLLAFIFAVGIASAVAVMQYFNWFDAVHWIVPLYRHGAAEGQIQDLLSTGLSRRASGTVGNPNLFAYILVVGLAYALTTGVAAPDRWTRMGHLLAALLILVGIALTLSRTGFVAALVVSVTVGGVLLLRGGWAWRGAGRLVSAGVASVVLLSILPDTLTGNFVRRVIDQFAVGVGQATSLAVRKDVLWSAALEQIEVSPFIGLGPAKAVLQRTIDNSYLTILRSTGIAGLLLWSFILLVPAFVFIRRLRTLSWPNFAYAMLGLAMVPAMMIYSLTSDILRNPQLMGMTWFLIGFALEVTVESTSNDDLAFPAGKDAAL